MATCRVNGEVLVRNRVLRLLTQEEVAAGVGITRGALARAEAGGPIRMETARRLAAFYELDPKDVVVFQVVA